MRKTLIAIASLACLLWLPSLGRAQAIPAGGGLGRLQIGAAFSYAIPDFWTLPYNSDPQYAFQSIGGVTGFGDYYITPHFGVEGDFHCLALITSLDRAEFTYLVGPGSPSPWPFHRLRQGHGRHPRPLHPGAAGQHRNSPVLVPVPSGSNIGYSIGGGLDVQYNEKIVIRAFDYESQSWPGYGPNGISPSVFTFGVAYRFH